MTGMVIGPFNVNWLNGLIKLRLAFMRLLMHFLALNQGERGQFLSRIIDCLILSRRCYHRVIVIIIINRGKLLVTVDEFTQ